MSRRVAAVVAILALASPALAQRLPPGLTPLGPVQAPLPSGPTQSIGPAPGQDPSAIIESQPLPPIVAPEATSAPPAVVPAPAPAPVTPAPATPAPTPPAPAPAPPAATMMPSDWQPRTTVVLQALDKVTARVNRLTGKVGETLRFGTLAIVVRACVARPADQAPDSAAFLEVTDGAATAPLFRAWMFAAEPALAVLEHPVYDLRVTACTP